MRSTNGGVSWNNMGTSIFIGKSVCFAEPNLLYVYGIEAAYGTNIVYSYDTGLTWYNASNPGIGSEIKSLFFANHDKAFATGSLRDTFAYSNNGGITWIKKSLGTLYYNYRQIQFANENDGWILTDYGNIIRTTDCGDNWSIHNTLGDNTRNMTFIESLNGWVIGNSGSRGVISKTTTGGTNWQRSGDIPDENPVSVKFRNLNTGWVIGESGYITSTTNSGESWEKNFDLPNDVLKSVVFSDRNTLWISSNNNERGIWKSTNAGNNWTEVYNSALTNVNSLYSIDNEKILGTGDYGLIANTTDGGNTWNSQYLGSFNFHSIKFYDDHTGWVVGSNGSIFKSTNGGVNWEAQNSNSSANFHSISCATNEKCFAVGDGSVISKTTDGGNTWNNLAPLSNIDNKQVNFVNENTGFITASQFFYIGIGVYYTVNNIFRTTDGGDNWALVHHENFGSGHFLNSISFVDSVRGTIAGGNGRILRTTNSGSNWFEYIANGLPENVDLYSIDYYNNIGVIAGSRGVLMSTDNNVIGINSQQTVIPEHFLLYQNYPNPFNPETKIKFELNRNSEIKLSLYDIQGRLIKTLFSGLKNAGAYEIKLNAEDLSLASGMYIYSLESEKRIENKKLMFIK
ncbi:MAG: YCF48-related protein [Ignavibacteria bacterium]